MQNLRLIVTEAVMTVVVVIMVIVLTFVAMGYKFDQDGELSQNGLVQISTVPSGAMVVMDGETLFARTDTSRSLSAGEHTVELSRAGYDTWKKTISIQSGWLYKLDYPRLFKQERESVRVTEFEKGLEFFSMSPDRNSILYADENSTKWIWMNVKGDEVERKEIMVAELFGLEKTATELPGEIRQISWNDDSNRVLVDWVNGEIHNNIVVNLGKVENSLNLTTAFGMDFSKVLPASSSAERLWVIENGNLRMISSKEISRILLSDVADFANYESQVLFVTRVREDGTQAIGYYEEGDKVPITLETVAGDGVRLGVSKYLDERYLTIAVGPEISIYVASDIREDSTIEDLKLVKQVTATMAPEMIMVHNRGRLVAMVNDKHTLMFDMEQKAASEFDLETEFEGWLDGFMLTNVVEGKLVVRDFDGENRREIVTAESGFPAMVTSNDQFLYYVTNCAEQEDSGSCLCLQRDRL